MSRDIGELQMSHRCAVCWEEQVGYANWYEHAVEVHGASLAPFYYDVCEHHSGCQLNCSEHVPTCPGRSHSRRLPNYGSVVRRPRPDPAPFTARDGTVYTPVPLFSEVRGG